MKIDGETRMRMIKREMNLDPQLKRERLQNGAYATIMLFVPILVISTVLHQWFG